MTQLALKLPISGQSRFFDNSSISDYKSCPRKYMLRHLLGWRSEGIAMPLAFGLAWHSGMDVVWAHAGKVSPDELANMAAAKFCETWEAEGLPVELDIEQIEKMSPRTPSIAHEMFVNYVNTRWAFMKSCELVASEQPFAVPLPETTDTWYIGRLDKVIRHEGQIKVIEHKTTSEYKKDGGFKSSYVDSWYSDSQVKGYQFGAGLFFDEITQVWVDAALVHNKVHDAFRFIPVAHQYPLLQEWIRDTRDWVDRINRDTERRYFPKNESSCMGKFGPCPYLDICRTTPDPLALEEPPPGYIVEHWQPFETLGLDKLIKGA